MTEHYTDEELQSKTRVQLRRLAVSTYGMDNKECSNTKSGELIAYILEKQEGGGEAADPPKKDKPSEAKGKKGGRGLARRPGRGKKEEKEAKGKGNGEGKGRGKAKDPEPEPEPEVTDVDLTEVTDVDLTEVTDVDLTEVTERIDAVGGALDENQTELKSLMGDILAGLDDVKRNQYIQWGMLSDIYTGENVDADLDARLDTLEKEFDEDDDSGND